MKQAWHRLSPEKDTGGKNDGLQEYSPAIINFWKQMLIGISQESLQSMLKTT